MRHVPLARPMALQHNLYLSPADQAHGLWRRRLSFFFGRDPCPSARLISDQAHGFWRRGLRNFWALTEKAGRRVCCTGLRASWSELAYARSLSASKKEPL
jgi:hypothetical protein